MLADLEPLSTSLGAYAFVVLLGLLWGSFANVCIYRWPPSEGFPNGRSVVAPGSHCFACKTPIRWYDNVPLVSWLWLRGACRTCKAPFSARYLIVEAVTGGLFGLAWWGTVVIGVLWEPFDVRLERFAIYAAFCFVMVVVTFIDLDHKLILRRVTIPSGIIFYGLSLVLPGHHWYDGLAGAAVGYGLGWSVREIYWLLANREGLGDGDADLLAVIGALLGMRAVVVSLFGGAMIGSVIGVIALVGARDPEPEPDAESTTPRRGPWSTVLPLIAVVSVVGAAVAAFAGHVVIGAVGGVISVGSLVAARRLDGGGEAGDDADEPLQPAPPRTRPGDVAVRVLAVIAAMTLLATVTSASLGWQLAALVSTAAGAGLLLGARRIAGEGVDDGEPELQGAAPSLMRMELPFGPFLALAAVFYLFAEPWIQVQFTLPGG